MLLTRVRSRPFRAAAAPFAVTAEDGVSLAGTRLGTSGPALVFCHGFLGWHRKAPVAAFLDRLAGWFRVYAFDFRGHGSSGGACTFGSLEHLDADAVVRLARAETGGPVVTTGISMGGVAAIRQAAFHGGVEAVVAVSTPARWDGHRSRAVRRMRAVAATRRGRRLASALGVRLGAFRPWPEAPEDLVGRLAPTPLILVHGRDDHFFDEEQVWRLYRRAGEPKRLLLATRFGHAEDGLTPAFAPRLARWVHEALGSPFPS